MDTNNTGINKYLVPVAVVLAGLFIGGAVIWNGSHGTTGGNTGGNGAPVAVNIKDVKTAGEPFIGSASAPVTIAFWSDFQCPFCKQFELTTLPQIISNYVDQGKVKVIFKDFEFLGPDSDTAALYARAMWKLYPNQYMEWRTKMYAAQDAENSGFGDEASVIALTKKIVAVDAAKVTADVKANAAAYKAANDADRTEAANFGINATPSFVIGKQMIAGAQPYPTFQAAIDALLK